MPEDHRDPPLDTQAAARARHVRDLLLELWGDELPPSPDPQLTVLTDALALDDERGRRRRIITQGEGLTLEVLHQLLRAREPIQQRLLLLPPGLQQQMAERVVASSRLPVQGLDRLRD